MELPVTRLKRTRRGVPALTSGSGGFSLLEMLVALVILSVSILAMTSVTLTSIKTNLHNDIRNAAIRLTSETAEQILAEPIDSAVSGTADRNLKLRGKDYPFRVVRAVQNLTNDLRQVVITVQYNYRGQQYSNTAVIYKHRAQ